MLRLVLLSCLSVSVVVGQQCADAGVGICINGVGCKANENALKDRTYAASMEYKERNFLLIPNIQVLGLIVPQNGLLPFVTTAAPCVDKINPNTGYSDCPRMTSYCNNSAYYALMTDQCPRTCGRCSGNGGIVTKKPCVDLINPKTGRSDCPGMTAYCNNSAYYTLMTEQCPKTCNRCPA